MTNDTRSFWRLRGAVAAQALITGLTAVAAGGAATGSLSTQASAQQALPSIDVQTQKPQKRRTPKKQPANAARTRAEPANAASEGATPAAATPEGVVLNGGPAVTQTTAGPVSGYRALTGVSATHTDTPIERTPQTINVVPGAVIQDQHPLSQSELLQNVSGVVGMPAYNFTGYSYKIRGFAAERYVDGISNFSDAGDFGSTVNLERVEVIKGPGGLFYQGGHGVIGGMINSVSKMPTDVRSYEGGTTFGSYGLWTQWFDVNQPLTANGTVLFRMTGEHSKSGDFVDVIERESYSLNPTWTFTNKTDTTLTIQGRFSRREQQDYSGLPASGTLDQSKFSIRPDLFPGNPNLPKSTSQINGVTVTLDHKFDSIWSANISARVSEIRTNELAQSVFQNTPDKAPSSFYYYNIGMPENYTDLSVNPNLIAKFSTGAFKNTLLLGADYNRVTDKGQMWLDMWGGMMAGRVDLANPDPIFPAFKDPAGTILMGETDNVYVNSGATAQLQSTVGDRLHLLGGLRLAHVEILSRAPTSGKEFDAEETKLLPRVGAAFDLARGITPYVSYSEGLRGVRFFNSTQPPKPEESKQTEGGVKLALPYGFSSTLAVFDLTRANVATADPANPFVQIQTGEQHSQGFEADLTWQPAPGLSFIASYAHVDTEVSKDNKIPVGNRLAQVPTDSGRIWANYKFLDGPLTGFSVGAGVYAASDQALALDNKYVTPGYATVDAKIGYEINNWSFALNAKNLLNHQYYIPYDYLDGRVAPGTPLAVYGSISYKY